MAQNNATDNSNVNNAPQAEEKSAVNDAITSIKDAMASGKTMKCVYTIKDPKGQNGMTASTFVDGKKYRTDMAVAGSIQHMIFDSEAMYSWAEGQKTGMKMTTACSQELAKNVPKTQADNSASTPDPTGEKTFDNATDVKCEAAGNVDFSVPTEVTFTDQCEMMKNVMKNVPSGVKVPNMPSGVPGNLPSSAPQL